MEMKVRQPDGSVLACGMAELDWAALRTGVPWRRFSWAPGQKHFPGLWWAATTGTHVGYESRLERARLALMDFDTEVSWVMSQPFQMEGVWAGRPRRFVPDYAFVNQAGELQVVEVKRLEALQRESVSEALEGAREVFSDTGIPFEVVTEPEPVRWQNVQFLAGYRRSVQFPDEDVQLVSAVIGDRSTIGDAVRAATSEIGDVGYARAVVLHLLWRQDWVCDLSARTIQVDTVMVRR